MSILGQKDEVMGETPAPKAVKGKQAKKEGVKTLAKKTVPTKKNKPNKQKKKESKSAVLSEKKNSMSSLKVLKNQLWMKVVKELAGRANLIPIHQEILEKLVGRTCVPQHKDRFGTFVGSCLKIDKEKHGASIGDLFMMLKKAFKKHCQTAGLQKAAVAATQVKKEKETKKPSKKVVDRSHLTKSQRKRLRRTERQKLARARDGILKPSTKKGKKSNQNSKSNKSVGKKGSVQKIKTPKKKVMNKGLKKDNKGKQNEIKAVKMEVE